MIVMKDIQSLLDDVWE